MATVTLGSDIRRWTTYTITDLTEQEAATLANNFETAAVELLRQLVRDERAVESHYSDDDNPDLFAEYASPAVIGFDPEEES